MKAEPVKNILEKVFAEIKEKKSGEILKAWEEAVGKQICAHTKPVYFKGGLLVVNVDRTSWLYELNLRKPDLIRQLKKKILRHPLKELRFRIGAVDK